MPKYTSVEYKNIQSVGNSPITIELDRSPNTLIGGANGSGKSTLGYAITYGLFGRFPSGIKLTQAINTINKKNLLVKVKFVERGDEYEVVRGEKPKKFEIWKNGEMLDQDANARDQQKKLEMIIGCDYQMFTQVVMLNKERYVPFMQMSTADRRKIVEDILDIKVFSEMNVVCKARIKEVEREVANIERKQEVAETEQAGILKLAEQISEQIEQQDKQSGNEVKEAREKVDLLKKEKDELTEKIDEISLDGHDKVMEQIDEFHDLAREFTSKKKTSQSTIDFLKENDICPTCEQDIDPDIKKKRVEEADNSIKELDTVVEDMMGELQKVVDKNEEFKKLKTEKQNLQQELRDKNTELKYAEADYDRAVANSEVDDSLKEKLAEHVSAYEASEQEIELIREEHEGILRKKELLEVMKQVLKDDGIKSMVVNQYIDLFNVKVNEYVNAMNFYINITFDSEFNESFHSLGRENFSVENLSTGQKTRLNLAILLAFLEIASIKNSVVTNLLFVDEMLENLDAEGAKDFMNLCREKLSDKNIFVITQRYEEFLDLFRSNIQFKLNNDFTEIE